MASRPVASIGARSMLGGALQPDETTAVISRNLLEYRTGGLDGEQELLYSEYNHDSPSPRSKAVVGDFSGQGDFNTEVTPKRAIPMMLTALFGTPTETILSPDTPAVPTAVVGGTAGTTTRMYWIVARSAEGYPSLPSTALTVTTGNATLTVTNNIGLSWTAVTGATSYDVLEVDGTGAVSTANLIGSTNGTTFSHNGAQVPTAYVIASNPVSQKTWKHTWDRMWMTFCQKKGDGIFAFPFCALHRMNIRVDRGQREVITSQFGAKIGNMWTMADPSSSSGAQSAAMTACGLDTALYDDANPFSPARAIVKIAEVGGSLVAAARVKGWSLNFDRNTADEYCLNGKLGPYGFVDGISGLDVSMDAYFKSGAETDLKLFMGYSSSVSSESAYGFQGVVQEVTTSCLFPYPSGMGYDYSLEFVLPRSCYGQVGIPVGGRGEPIMANVRVEPIYDGDNGTDLIINIISDETMASIIATDGTVITGPSDMVQ